MAYLQQGRICELGQAAEGKPLKAGHTLERLQLFNPQLGAIRLVEPDRHTNTKAKK